MRRAFCGFGIESYDGWIGDEREGEGTGKDLRRVERKRRCLLRNAIHGTVRCQKPRARESDAGRNQSRLLVIFNINYF